MNVYDTIEIYRKHDKGGIIWSPIDSNNCGSSRTFWLHGKYNYSEACLVYERCSPAN